MLKQLALGICILLSTSAFAGNETNDSFSQAKKYLKPINEISRANWLRLGFMTVRMIALPMRL